MTYAQITNGIVSAVSSTAADNTWQPCGSAVEVGWSFDGNSFTPPIVVPPAPTIPTFTLQQQAEIELNKSDITIVRCNSAGVSVPTAWQTYRDSLRAIFNGTDTTSTVLPTKPSYPAGT